MLSIYSGLECSKYCYSIDFQLSKQKFANLRSIEKLEIQKTTYKLSGVTFHTCTNYLSCVPLLSDYLM